MGGGILLFHTFSSQEERRKFGCSYFIELQYCRLALGTEIEKIVSVNEIEHWKNDSLYIHGNDDNKFASHYGEIFTGGIYSNRKSGIVDLYGINYYSQQQAHLISEQIKIMKPLDYPTLLNWLEKSKENMGFYILGL